VDINGVEKTTMDGWSIIELDGHTLGIHHIKLQWRSWSWEEDFKLSFPDLDPDLLYANSVLRDRKPTPIFVAAYYGWYGVEDLNWVH